MSRKMLGVILIVAGVLMIAAIFVAPALGFGHPYLFTLKKMTLAGIGLIAAVAGVVLSMQKKPAA